MAPPLPVLRRLHHVRPPAAPSACATQPQLRTSFLVRAARRACPCVPCAVRNLAPSARRARAPSLHLASHPASSNRPLSPASRLRLARASSCRAVPRPCPTSPCHRRPSSPTHAQQAAERAPDPSSTQDDSPRPKRVSFDGAEPARVFEADEWDQSSTEVTLRLTYKDVVELRELNVSMVRNGPLMMERTPSRRPTRQRCTFSGRAVRSHRTGPFPMWPSSNRRNVPLFTRPARLLHAVTPVGCPYPRSPRV